MGQLEPRKKTLILDLDETLIHSEAFQEGKKYAKVLEFPSLMTPGVIDKLGVYIRPYCAEFLERMAKLYELVVYTASTQDYADEVCDLLDPKKQYFSTRLFREHCSKIENVNVK